MPVARVYRRRSKSPDEVRDRRVAVVWGLLFVNVLGAPSGGLHRLAQALTQAALVGALLVALSINPKGKIRPHGVFLGLYSLLAVLSLMMSVRFVGLGTAYRGVRLVVFLVVLWLLTPWWGSRKLLLLRSHLRYLGFIVGSVVLGLLVYPPNAYPNHRLSGWLWPIPATQVAHYTAELVGLTLILWLCRMVSRRQMLLVVLPGTAAVVATHTRTALLAALAGLLAAGLSLFTGSRRVRRAFAVSIAATVLLGVPFSSLVSSWAARGENSTQIKGLSGRTESWALVLGERRPKTEKILGSGLSNGGVNKSPSRDFNGLPIDSGWILTYQDQGIAGDVLEATMFLVLLVAAAMRPRGPTRAIALFLTLYCLVASFTESGMGNASAYLLDLTVAAALIAVPAGWDERETAPGWA